MKQALLAIRPALLAALLSAGCASRRPPTPPDPDALEAARREERQRILDQYWYDQAVSAPRAGAAPAQPDGLLAYPAGVYDGLRFAARRAADPSLEEPVR